MDHARPSPRDGRDWTGNPSTVRAIARHIHAVLSWQLLPHAAKAEHNADRAGLSRADPGISRALEEAVGWLYRAQDHSASRDGGASRHFSLAKGWARSYPETTGYIIPTLLTYANSAGSDIARQRARRMLDWLISIQFPEGGFQGGSIGEKPHVPVAFNTGQILLGLAAGVAECGNYQNALVRAADWLVNAQDPDGAWRKFHSPFAAAGEKAYDTHVAWGLLEAARVASRKPYAEAALANVRWALTLQHENGWLDKCCLTDATQPLTHTIGYALRGMIEAYRFSSESAFLEASLRTANGLLTAMRDDGFMPGRLDYTWKGTVPWACLTGTAQIAICWFLLYQITGESRYFEAASAANRYVRRTVNVDGPPGTRGGVKGSFPVYGEYGRYLYLNWACKFFIDANLLENEVRGR